MKRDMELMRKILVAIEEQYIPGEGTICNLKIEKYSMAEIAEHCKYLHQEGLIDDFGTQYADNTIINFGIGNLTDKGCDFLDLIRGEEVWNKTKEEMIKGNHTVSVEKIWSVAKDAMDIIHKVYQMIN